ncbi:MAG: hypothetical protein CME62_16245 [Halobacteriovoraceae bacterium]|nr:hypothetical protein [Halobacteriovoraceae bacterium]|tara:strand:+ start:76 stop:402 length:327 start_codon:yes stop_codon:yes gene_type:complete
MKIIVLCLTFVTSLVVLADTASDSKVAELEARIKALESQLGTSATSNGLKVQDMGNTEMKNQLGGRNVSSETPKLTEEQQKEIMQTIELYKQRQAESQKLLDELMNEP